MSTAFSAVFQRMVQWDWPFPMGSSDSIAMYPYFRAACSFKAVLLRSGSGADVRPSKGGLWRY